MQCMKRLMLSDDKRRNSPAVVSKQVTQLFSSVEFSSCLRAKQAKNVMSILFCRYKTWSRWASPKTERARRWLSRKETSTKPSIFFRTPHLTIDSRAALFIWLKSWYQLSVRILCCLFYLTSLGYTNVCRYVVEVACHHARGPSVLAKCKRPRRTKGGDVAGYIIPCGCQCSGLGTC